MTLGLFGALGLLDSGLFSKGLFGGFWGALVLLHSGLHSHLGIGSLLLLE